MQQLDQNILPVDLLPHPTLGSKGHDSSISEHSHFAQQIKVNAATW